MTLYDASRRLRGVPFSPIREVLRRATELEAAGERVLHFELGRPNFDTPTNIKEAAARALSSGSVHYTSNYGIPELRREIAVKLSRQNGVIYDPETEIVVTAGLSEAVFSTMLALLDVGDEIIVMEPAWPHYSICALLANARAVCVATRAEDGFLPDPDAIESAISARTRAIILNSPGNPTGAVYPRALLERIGEIAERHRLVLVSDEIYEGLVWDGGHVSAATVGGNHARTITLNGFSKTFSMTGWRIGYVAAPLPLLTRILLVHQYNTVCVTTFAQYGALEAYAGDQTEVRRMRDEFRKRREVTVDGLKTIPQLSLVPPQGAFYAFPRIELGLNSRDVCRHLIETAGVAVVPGDAFGQSGAGHMRLSFAASEQDLRDGIDCMRDALAGLAQSASQAAVPA